MSGGSYNYLCYKEASQLGEYRDELEQMAERLADLGYAADAAAETYVILNALRRTAALWEAAHKSGLIEVWRGIEWWDSGAGDEEWSAGEDG